MLTQKDIHNLLVENMSVQQKIDISMRCDNDPTKIEKAEKTVKAVKKQGMETVWERQERGETDRWGMLLPGIVFIGGFLFHLVWEAKGQYSVVYFMLLLPYAYLGMERVADVFLDVTGAGKE